MDTHNIVIFLVVIVMAFGMIGIFTYSYVTKLKEDIVGIKEIMKAISNENESLVKAIGCLVKISESRNKLDNMFMDKLEKDGRIIPYSKTYKTPKDELSSIGTDNFYKYISADMARDLFDAGYITYTTLESPDGDSYVTVLSINVVKEED